MKRLLIAHILMFVFPALYICSSFATENDSLRTAIYDGNIEEVKIAIENGADVNKIYDDETTPLLQALDKSGVSSEIINLLFQYGANPAIRPSGASVVSAAIKTNNEEIIQLLRPYAVTEGEFYELSLFYKDRKEDSYALEYAARALKLNPANHEAWVVKGTIYSSQSNINDAETAYRNAFEEFRKIHSSNNSTDVYTKLVWYAVLAGYFNEALKIGKEGLLLFPDTGPLEANIGHALLFLGNKREAIVSYRKSLKLKQNEQSVDRAGQLASVDFSSLRERYPDKLALLDWADKRLREPLDLAFDELPFGQERSVVLQSMEGAYAHKEEAPIIGIVDPILKEQFGDGLYTSELKTQLSFTVVEKYNLTCENSNFVDRMDLFFTAMPGKEEHRTLFLVSKYYKEKQGNRDVVFNAMQQYVSGELGVQPALYTLPTPSSGPNPETVAVWKLNDATVMLVVTNTSALSVRSRIFYVSKMGWETYLKSLRAKTSKRK